MSLNIAVCINYVDYSTSSLELKRKKKRQDVAIEVLADLKRNEPDGINIGLLSLNFSDDKVDLPDEFRVLKKLKRDSKKEIGNNRRLPYLKEIYDISSMVYCDYFGFMNSDILLKGDFFKLFESKADVYILYRTDIEEVSRESFDIDCFRVLSHDHAGNDAFFFRRQWWIDNKKHFPDDLILGETEWDTVYRELSVRLTKNHHISRDLFHVYHDAKWNLTSPGAKQNIKIWNNVKKRIGWPT